MLKYRRRHTVKRLRVRLPIPKTFHRILTGFVPKGRINVQLASCFTGLASTKQVNLLIISTFKKLLFNYRYFQADYNEARQKPVSNTLNIGVCMV